MMTGSHDLFRFGDFELDVDAYVLRRGGRPVRLEQQPMDLLILLVQQHPRLVTRAEIIERLWGPDTFVEAESSINTAIRKVRQALGDSAASPAFVERIPGKGYRFAANVSVDTRAGEPASDSQPPHDLPLGAPAAQIRFARTRRLLIGIGALVVLIAATLGARLFRSAGPTSASRPRVAPLTRLTGTERHPSLSPDGRQVAFAWDGESQDNFDIYVKLLDSSEVRRLTSDPAPDLAPRWSPDGRQIAYVRVHASGTSSQLRVMSALGGSDRAVAELPALFESSWSADGRHLAVGRARPAGDPSGPTGIYLVPLDGGEPRAVTRPGASAIDDSPAFSRDGRQLAYASCRDTAFRFECQVKVVSVDATLQATGPARTLTRQPQRRISGIAWTPDGSSIVYGAGLLANSHLWRVPADGSSAPERIEEAGEAAGFPATSWSTDSLAFSRASYYNDIYRFEPGRGASPVAQSAGVNAQPEFSPDGRRFVFCSDRSGMGEVWIAAADGSGARQLTRGPGLGQCSPAWSPDGRRIAFDSVGDDGRSQIWIVDVDGGAPQQITKEPGPHVVPRWSRDGLWIYCSSLQGVSNIWRAHVMTGRLEQVTKTGSGWSSTESADGTGILYAASTSDSPLLFQPNAGGAPRTIRPCVAGGSTVSTGPGGIYYLPCANRQSASAQPVHVFDPGTGQDRMFGILEGYYRSSDAYTTSFRKFALSPDGHTILYQRRLPSMSDLMLIEHFR